ncbi:AraC-type DNA-binding protein [Pedobacter steynii]|uniref:AraC-type DNA-binding protein n=1 Tax=Pedobacter steynii TaxID=430522 RepID=A0A1G9U4N0_9SPHI|nr:AraC family transcriptional regulator [Pedobacter steynii]NQX40655.1 helix-turn-helix transcriptional regulator [Pedobacter steynii]SDM54907.1 AraC-type DNA-binding protein [Pedobacter steynii]
MIFEFTSSEHIGMLSAFAKAIGSKVENGIVELPEHLGNGYMRGLDLGPQIRMMIRQYELNEDLVFRRSASGNGTRVVVIAFHNFFYPSSDKKPGLPFVQITTAGIDYEDFFPVNSTINTIIIAVNVDLLKTLLHPGKEDALFQEEDTLLQEEDALFRNILYGNQPFLYEELISPQMQALANQIVTAGQNGPLQHFFYRLKAEELIYLLFMELLKRREAPAQTLNVADVKKIYQVKDKILAHIDHPPKLEELAKFSGMSESKLKRLFKQIFGKNIYDYYQSFRMTEAAYLLKEKGLSVSETGYQLGFSNLSHFARVFEKYIGLKPKRYASTNASL